MQIATVFAYRVFGLIIAHQRRSNRDPARPRAGFQGTGYIFCTSFDPRRHLVLSFYPFWIVDKRGVPRELDSS